MREKNYDVLAISESRLNSTTTNTEVEIAGYKITSLERTRETVNSSALIDVIVTSSIDLVERSGVLKSQISDHFLMYAFLKL